MTTRRSFLTVATSSLLAAPLFASPLAASLGLGARAAAQDAAGVPPILAGRYRYSRDAAHGAAIVRAAIAPAIESMPELLRGFARDRLEERTHIPMQVEVTLTGRNVRVVSTGERTLTVEGPLGQRTQFRRSDGHTGDVTQGLRSGWLEHDFQADQGAMRVLYSTEPDGATLHVDYTMTSQLLARPIRYRLDYVRA